MKKVTLTFIVDDEVLYEVSNELCWKDYGAVAQTLDEYCEDSWYDEEDL